MIKTNFAIGLGVVLKNIEAQLDLGKKNEKLRYTVHFSPQQKYFHNEFDFSLEIKRFFRLTKVPTEIR